MLGKVCKGTGPTQPMGCWSTLCRREGEHLQYTPGCSTFLTAAVNGLAHLHGQTWLCTESLPLDLEVVCLSACCCVLWLSPSSNWNIGFPVCKELALACSILQGDVWCSADIPLKVPGKQGHTSTVDLIWEIQLNISSQANPPTWTYQVFQLCIRPAVQQGFYVAVTSLDRGTKRFCVLCIMCSLWAFKRPRKQT